MPEIGDIVSGKSLGKTQRGNYVYVACSVCGKPRWINYFKLNNPKYFRNICSENGCQQRERARKQHSSDNMYWDGKTELKVGMKISVADLKRLGHAFREHCRAMLIWHQCTNCRRTYWREFSRGYKELCELCRTRDNGKITKSVWNRDINYKNKRVHNIMSNSSMKTSKEETRLKQILDYYYPDKYDHVGKGTIVIGGKNPDFIDGLNRVVILMHGEYWHLWRRRKIENNPNLTKEDMELRDIIHYAKYGYTTIIIWGKDVNNITTVLNKIDNYHNLLTSTQ